MPDTRYKLPMRISFFGACREVTGSHFLIEENGSKVLLDCGIWQGFRLAEERNYNEFAFDPTALDAVVISHSHLDHVGRLPKLFKDGFRGKIYSTAPTRDLTRLILEDNEKLMSEEAERNDHPPLYGPDDVSSVMELFTTLEYAQRTEVAPGIFLTLKNAGHILGSALVILQAGGKTLCYTGDLGNNPSLLLDAPDDVGSADIVICESTYGGRIHEDVSRRLEKLSQIINATIAQNGVLIIPSFAIERTQELLHDIDHFCSVYGCQKPTFYLDSPLAIKVTSVFENYRNFLSKKLPNANDDPDLFGLDRIKITQTVEESKGIRHSDNPKVIIAGSGMMNGGRILFHARDFLINERNALLIVGYQASGTLGRRLLDGENDVKILGESIDVRAKVWAIGSYSAHADSIQILDFLAKIKNLSKVFLVHGEADQAVALSGKIEKKLKVDVHIPQEREVVTIDG